MGYAPSDMPPPPETPTMSMTASFANGLLDQSCMLDSSTMSVDLTGQRVYDHKNVHSSPQPSTSRSNGSSSKDFSGLSGSMVCDLTVLHDSGPPEPSLDVSHT